MYVTDLEEVMDIMLVNIEDNDSVNYVADAETIRVLLQLVCFNTDYVPDIIEFNSEEEGYYYLSFDKDEDGDISFSVYDALDEEGDFVGMRGILYVDEEVPEYFEQEVSYDKLVHPVRVYFEDECDGDCEHCLCHNENPEAVILVDDDDNVNGFHKEWSSKENGVRSYYSFTFRSSDEDTVFNMLKHFD